MNVADILDGPEFFTCDRFRARLKKSRCVERQEARFGEGSGLFKGQMRYAECQECEQGKGVREERIKVQGQRIKGENGPAAPEGYAVASEEVMEMGKKANVSHDPGVRICKTPGCGRPVGIRKNGKPWAFCDECRKRKISAGMKRMYRERGKLEALGKKAQQGGALEPGATTITFLTKEEIPDQALVLDVKAWRKGLIGEIEEAARFDVRTVEEQAIYYIVRGLAVDQMKRRAEAKAGN